MELFAALLGLMDSTIFAMMQVPILAFFLVGSLVTAVLGVFIVLKDAARGRSGR